MAIPAEQRFEKSEITVMEKRKTVCLGARKEKPFKRRKKSLPKVFDYLKSDSYMFAPLLSYPSSGFAKPVNDVQFDTQGVGLNESAEEDNGFLDKVSDYLSFDCHMYAPLVVSHETDARRSLSQEPVWSHTRERVALSSTKLIVRKHVSTDPLQDVVSHDGNYKTPPPPRAHKHVIYQNCRSLCVTGKGKK